MPVGPNVEFEYVRDTIESIYHYTQSSSQVVIADDSEKNFGARLQQIYKDLDYTIISGKHGLGYFLYRSLSQAYLHAFETYHFDVVLKIDTDALVIGDRPEEDAIRFLKDNPGYGLIGSYKVDCNGDPRDFSPHANTLKMQTNGCFLLKNPKIVRGFFLLRSLLKKAKANDYELGEHCQGGAYFFSGLCLRRLYAANLLYRKELRFAQLSEDAIAALLVKSIGMNLGDFATGSLPVGIRWRGLPGSPEDLMNSGKKIIHSTRFWNTMQEKEIRSYFKKIRDGNI